MQCSGSSNPVYPVAFLVSMAGPVVLSFGVFGRRFVLGPLYAVGTLLLGFGSFGVTFGYLCDQWSASQPYSLCVAYDPEFFAQFIVAGLVLIGGNGFLWWRGLQKRPQIAAEPH